MAFRKSQTGSFRWVPVLVWSGQAALRDANEFLHSVDVANTFPRPRHSPSTHRFAYNFQFAELSMESHSNNNKMHKSLDKTYGKSSGGQTFQKCEVNNRQAGILNL